MKKKTRQPALAKKTLSGNKMNYNMPNIIGLIYSGPTLSITSGLVPSASFSN